MAHVQFTKDFDWSPRPRSFIAYKAGQKLTVRRECADAAIAAGAAREVDAPRRSGSKDDGDD